MAKYKLRCKPAESSYSKASHRAGRRRWKTLLTAAWTLGPLPLYASTETYSVTLDQQTNAVSDEGLSQLEVGQKIDFVVVNTDRDCFDYNAYAASPPTVTAAAAGEAPPPVTLTRTHQRGVKAYKIEVTKNPKTKNGETPEQAKARCAALGLQDRTWTIPVETLGWEIALSGAFTLDGLVGEKYFLDPVLPAGMPPQFAVRRDKDAEDNTNQRLAVMIHLYNSKFDKQHDSLSWAPLSLGIGFDDNTRYLIGTSLKFGDAVYVTAGAVFGEVASLPTGLREGALTADQNALATPSQRSTQSYFIAFSYSFLSTSAKDKFASLFGGTAQPKPQ